VKDKVLILQDHGMQSSVYLTKVFIIDSEKISKIYGQQRKA